MATTSAYREQIPAFESSHHQDDDDFESSHCRSDDGFCLKKYIFDWLDILIEMSMIKTVYQKLESLESHFKCETKSDQYDNHQKYDGQLKGTCF